MVFDRLDELKRRADGATKKDVPLTDRLKDEAVSTGKHAAVGLGIGAVAACLPLVPAAPVIGVGILGGIGYKAYKAYQNWKSEHQKADERNGYN